MIEICSLENGIIVTGHARAAPRGQDIVCAAVSALIQTFAASAEVLLPTKEFECEITAGKAVITETGNLSDPARVLRDSLLIGLEAIAESYPQNVRIDPVFVS